MMTINSSPHIKRVVIPAAGLGTRLLPFTKAIPKEMLPIGNKPLIQHAVEEALSSGISEVILVTAPQKSTIGQHFRRDLQLEQFLERRGCKTGLEKIRSIAGISHLRTVCQDQPNGLGNAVMCVREMVGHEPFAMILPDALIINSSPCLRQLIDCYDALPGSYVATRELSIEECGRYGILKVSPLADGPRNSSLYRVQGAVEKPAAISAPSRFGIFGRYLFEASIFDSLDLTPPDQNGEIQLTDAMTRHCRKHPLYAFCFEGTHYDVGTRLGFLQASVSVALADPEVSEPFWNFLASLRQRRATGGSSGDNLTAVTSGGQ